MAKYKLSRTGVVLGRNNIPNDPDKRDWQEYLEWVAKGNVADPEFTPAELAAKKKHESDEKKHRDKKEKNRREAKTDNDDTLSGLARRIRRLEEEADFK